MNRAADEGHVELLINIDVESLPEAVRFYTCALGLRLNRMLFDDTVAELEGAGVRVMLLAKAADSTIAPGTRQTRTYTRHWTPVHLDFVVAQLEPAVERAVSAGARIEGELQTFPWGRQALLSDPFGNGFCLIQWLDGGYDAVAQQA
jgi:predicted enzyme related to lactoylglutathione lyase